ncbi:MAG: TRAP transporter small permease [Deferrisomatales bacterium]|nr:TRAP transporter small permease [Deferrisomatales bacterium]
MDLLIRLTERISDGMARVAAVVLGLMTALILLEILLWNTVTKTTLVADEYSAYGLAAIIFLGAGHCLKERGHIRITLLLSLLPDRLARVVTFLATAATTAFMGYLWWYLYLMVRSAYRFGSTSGTLTGTPLWIPQTVMLVGAAGLLLQLAGTTLKTLRAVGTGEEAI